METRPDIDQRALAEALEESWGVTAREIAFLPVGADPGSAAWRVTAAGGENLFLKTRLSGFDPAGLAVARFLRDSGIAEVIAPLPTRDGALAASFGPTALILYPFVDASDGFRAALSPAQWTRLGAALNRVHASALPTDVARSVESERYAPRWRDSVRRFTAGQSPRPSADSVASELGALLADRRADIARIVDRAESLADVLRSRTIRFVLCHTDLHAGNVLLGGDGKLHIVDWDSPRYARRERDLMFIGGGVGGVWNDPDDAGAFYAGYGTVDIDLAALAYYRYERIAEDIAVTCEQVFLGDGADRAESFTQLAEQWLRGGVVEIAHATYVRLQSAQPM